MGTGMVLARIFEQLILPPGLFFVLLCIGFLLLAKKPWAGRAFLATVMIAFYLLCTPYLAGRLVNLVQTHPALAPDGPVDMAAGAIVILSGDQKVNAPEYASDTVGKNTLLRTRYGAFLQRKTGLPILVSGGLLRRGASKSLAQQMADNLRQDFNAGEVWLEDGSRSTAENAYRSKAFLQEKEIDTVYLVTQAWHMPRAVEIFEKTGLRVIPAPTAFVGIPDLTLASMLPSAAALSKSRFTLREIAARIWYRLLY